MSTKTASRQIIDRTLQDQLTTQTLHEANLSGSGGKKSNESELDNLLDSINNELTPPLRLEPTQPTADRVVTVGSITVVNPETSKNRIIQPISTILPTFTGSTITVPSASGSNIVNSAGNDLLLTISNDRFIKCLVELNSDGNILLSLGNEGTTEALATLPAPTSGALAVGYFVISTVVAAVQNIDFSNIFQFEGGGGGSGSGGTASGTYGSFNAETDTITILNTGNNATWDNGGVHAATTAISSVTPLNGDKSFKSTQAVGSLNDWIASDIIDVPLRARGKENAMKLQYLYDGADDDHLAIVKDITNGNIISSSLDLVKNAAGTVATLVVQFFIPTTCTQIKVGFQTLVANSGKILQWDDIELTDDPFVFKNLTKTQSLFFQEGQTSMGDITGQCQFSIALTDSDFNGESILTIIDDGANTRTRFKALSPCVVDISWSADLNAINDWVTIVHFDSAGSTLNTFQGNATSAVADYATVSRSLKLDTGESFAVGSKTQLRSTTNNAIINIVATGETENVITPGKVSREYSEANGDFTITGTNWTTAVAVATVFKTNDGTWKMQFNIKGDVSPTPGSGNFQLTMSGVTWKSTMQRQAISTVNENNITMYGHTTFSTSNFLMGFSSSGALAIGLSGIVTLESKPTWADDVSTQFLAATPTQRTAYLKDIKTAGTHGGTFTSGSFVTRTLNDLSGDTSIVTLSANQFTLQSGEYKIYAFASAYQISEHKVKLRNITDSTDDIIGTSEQVPTSATTTSRLFGKLVLTAPKTFELQHRSATTQVTSGFGLASNYGVSEVYAQVIIERLR